MAKKRNIREGKKDVLIYYDDWRFVDDYKKEYRLKTLADGLKKLVEDFKKRKK